MTPKTLIPSAPTRRAWRVIPRKAFEARFSYAKHQGSTDVTSRATAEPLRCELARRSRATKHSPACTPGDKSFGLHWVSNEDSDDKPLRDHVDTCNHPACVATRKLEGNGARLTLGKGRHCERAVLAAAGAGGMTDGEIVAERRAYAEHLGVSLDGNTTGEIANAAYAIHARHAADGNVTEPARALWAHPPVLV